jgi:anti-sigma factor RsiW
MEPSEVADGHLTAEEAAAYVDGTLASPDRARVELHLARCSECRSEVVEVTRLVDDLPPDDGHGGEEIGPDPQAMTRVGPAARLERLWGFLRRDLDLARCLGHFCAPVLRA